MPSDHSRQAPKAAYGGETEREYLPLVSFLFAVALKPEKGRFIAIKSHRAITRKACDHAISELRV